MDTIKNYKGQDCETFWSTLSSNKFEYFCAKVGPEFWNHHVYLGRIRKKNDGRWDVWILTAYKIFKQRFETPPQMVLSTREDAIKKIESIWLEKEEQKVNNDKFTDGDLVEITDTDSNESSYSKGYYGRIMKKVPFSSNYHVRLDKTGNWVEIPESCLKIKEKEKEILKIPAKEHRIEYVSVPKEDIITIINKIGNNINSTDIVELLNRWKSALGV